MTRRPEEDIIGRTFDMLTVIREVEPYANKGKTRRIYECQCSCGNLMRTRSYELHKGMTRSCGCRRAVTMRANVLKVANNLAALQNRWEVLQQYGARMPMLKATLDDLEKEFPTT